MKGSGRRIKSGRDKRNKTRMLLTTALAILLCLTTTTVVSAETDSDNSGGGIPILGNWWNGFWSTVIGGVESGLKAVAGDLVDGIFMMITYIPPPQMIDTTKELWVTSFNIYLGALVPLALTVAGISIMFSSQPTNIALFEGVIRRIAYATVLAYFSFTIIDTVVVFTDYLAAMVITEQARTAAVNIIAPSLVIGGVLVVVFGIVEFALIFLIFLILGMRILVVHFAAAFMPVLCFMYIVGVGPLKRFQDLATEIWGYGIMLPTFSVIGAGLIGMITIINDILSGLGISSKTGELFIRMTLAVAVLGIPLLIPVMMQSLLGSFSAGVNTALQVARPFTGAATGALRRRFARHVSQFGKAAPLTAALPFPSSWTAKGAGYVKSKLASTSIGKKFADLKTKALQDPTISTIVGKTPGLKDVFRVEALTAADRGKAMAEVGLPSSALYKLADAAATLDKVTPDTHEKEFEEISGAIGTYAGKAISEVNPAERKRKLATLAAAVSGVLGLNRLATFSEILGRSAKANFHKLYTKNPRAAETLTTLIAAAKSGKVETLENLFASGFGNRIKKDLLEDKKNAKYAKATLAALGVSEDMLNKAIKGDFEALNAIQAAFEKVPLPNSEGYILAELLASPEMQSEKFIKADVERMIDSSLKDPKVSRAFAELLNMTDEEFRQEVTKYLTYKILDERPEVIIADETFPALKELDEKRFESVALEYGLNVEEAKKFARELLEAGAPDVEKLMSPDKPKVIPKGKLTEEILTRIYEDKAEASKILSKHFSIMPEDFEKIVEKYFKNMESLEATGKIDAGVLAARIHDIAKSGGFVVDEINAENLSEIMRARRALAREYSQSRSWKMHVDTFARDYWGYFTKLTDLQIYESDIVYEPYPRAWLYGRRRPPASF